MNKFGGWFGGQISPSASRETRSSKKKSIMRPSLNEDIADLSMLDFDKMEDVRVSAYPCNELLIGAGIYESFYELITNAGLLDFTTNEVPQYRISYLSKPLNSLMVLTHMWNSLSMIERGRCLLMIFAGILACLMWDTPGG